MTGGFSVFLYDRSLGKARTVSGISREISFTYLLVYKDYLSMGIDNTKFKLSYQFNTLLLLNIVNIFRHRKPAVHTQAQAQAQAQAWE